MNIENLTIENNVLSFDMSSYIKILVKGKILEKCNRKLSITEMQGLELFLANKMQEAIDLGIDDILASMPDSYTEEL